MRTTLPACHGRIAWASIPTAQQFANQGSAPSVALGDGTKHSTATHPKGQSADDRLPASITGHRELRSVEKFAQVQGDVIRGALARLDSDWDREN
jgi:hypothetical protein